MISNEMAIGVGLMMALAEIGSVPAKFVKQNSLVENAVVGEQDHQRKNILAGAGAASIGKPNIRIKKKTPSTAAKALLKPKEERKLGQEAFKSIWDFLCRCR